MSKQTKLSWSRNNNSHKSTSKGYVVIIKLYKIMATRYNIPVESVQG